MSTRAPPEIAACAARARRRPHQCLQFAQPPLRPGGVSLTADTRSRAIAWRLPAATWSTTAVGSSYMDYRDSGFWVKDFQAEVWLYLLAQEAATVPDAPVWLTEAGADWQVQATAGFMGFVSSCLDERLGTHAERVAAVLDLSHRVLHRLDAWSPAIPK